MKIITKLAIAWTLCYETPSIPDNIGKFVSLLYCALKLTLPDQKSFGLLSGWEDEIRQRAAFLLQLRYLANNRCLVAATEQGNLPETENQLRRSMNAAIRVASRALLRSLEREQQKCRNFEAIQSQSLFQHPAERKTLWELPFEVQRKLVLVSLRKALKEQRIPETGVKTAMLMVEKGLSQTELADVLGISPQAVFQRIASVRKYLRRDIENQEFPLGGELDGAWRAA